MNTHGAYGEVDSTGRPVRGAFKLPTFPPARRIRPIGSRDSGAMLLTSSAPPIVSVTHFWGTTSYFGNRYFWGTAVTVRLRSLTFGVGEWDRRHVFDDRMHVKGIR